MWRNLYAHSANHCLRWFSGLSLTVCLIFSLVACDQMNEAGDKAADAAAEAASKVPKKIIEKSMEDVHRNLDEMQEKNHQRAIERAEQAKRDARLKAIRGCTANAKRTKCSCFDANGSKDTILTHEQCLQVVDRGLAALHDF